MDAIVGPRTPRAIAGCKNRMAPSTDRRSNCPKRPRVGASDAGPYPRAGDYQCVFGWLALLEVAGNRLGVDAAGRNPISGSAGAIGKFRAVLDSSRSLAALCIVGDCRFFAC